MYLSLSQADVKAKFNKIQPKILTHSSLQSGRLCRLLAGFKKIRILFLDSCRYLH